MRKLPAQFENPIDHIILDVADRIVPTLHKSFRLSPNALTTIGNLIRGFSIYLLLNGHNVGFFITAVIGYIFDCLDGHCARMFQLCSKFGDYYDHVSDVLYHGILLYLVWQSNTLTGLSARSKWGVVLFFMIIGSLTLVHLGCQEQLQSHLQGEPCVQNEQLHAQSQFQSTSLAPLKNLCRNPEMIRWTRYFGNGTFILISYLWVAYFYRA